METKNEPHHDEYCVRNTNNWRTRFWWYSLSMRHTRWTHTRIYRWMALDICCGDANFPRVYLRIFYSTCQIFSTLMSTLPAFAGVLLRHGSHFLFVRRGEDTRHWPLHWTVPWGKIESWERAEDTAIRETLEEVGIIVRHINILRCNHTLAEYIDGSKEIFLFLVDDWIGMPENLEPQVHDRCQWMTLKEFEQIKEPIIPHILEAIGWLLAGKAHTQYHAI